MSAHWHVRFMADHGQSPDERSVAEGRKPVGVQLHPMV